MNSTSGTFKAVERLDVEQYDGDLMQFDHTAGWLRLESLSVCLYKVAVARSELM